MFALVAPYSKTGLEKYLAWFHYWSSRVKGYKAISVLVNRLLKYAHFIPFKRVYISRKMAGVFTKEIVRLHWVLQSIVNDKDPLFISPLLEEAILVARKSLKDEF